MSEAPLSIPEKIVDLQSRIKNAWRIVLGYREQIAAGRKSSCKELDAVEAVLNSIAPASKLVARLQAIL